MNFEDWSIGGFLSFAAATGLAAAIWSWAADLIKEWWRVRASAKYGAMRCAVVLEHYAASCWDNVNMAEGQFQMAQDAYADRMPEPPKFPDDIDWSSMDVSLADECLSFAPLTILAGSRAAYAKTYEQNDFDFDYEIKILGNKAISLASRLRSHYSLPEQSEYESLKRRLAD